MDTVYIALVRWGPEWDGQSIYKTKNKALFEQMCTSDGEVYFSEFSEELKSELRARYAQQVIDYPESASEPLDEEMSIAEAMDWLDCYGLDYNKSSFILGGETELTFTGNW